MLQLPWDVLLDPPRPERLHGERTINTGRQVYKEGGGRAHTHTRTRAQYVGLWVSTLISSHYFDYLLTCCFDVAGTDEYEYSQ